MQTKEFSYKGHKQVYYTRGEGPLVVLLHGFGEDATIWKNQYDIFPGYQLVIPDLPGSGKSEMIDDMTMEGMADAVKVLIERLTQTASPNPSTEGLSAAQHLPVGETAHITVSVQGEERSAGSPPLGGGGACLIGHSMGGYVTLAFAEKYPEALSAFGLFHSTAFADSERKKRPGEKVLRSFGNTGDMSS